MTQGCSCPTSPLLSLVSLQSLVRQVKETLVRGGSGEAPAPGHPAV